MIYCRAYGTRRRAVVPKFGKGGYTVLPCTTNLSLHEMRNPPDLAYARIYDRILERCAPILFDGENFRKQKAEENKNMARVIMAAGGRWLDG